MKWTNRLKDLILQIFTKSARCVFSFIDNPYAICAEQVLRSNLLGGFPPSTSAPSPPSKDMQVRWISVNVSVNVCLPCDGLSISTGFSPGRDKVIRNKMV